MIDYKCKTCGKIFKAYRSRKGQYCSMKCYDVSLAGNQHAANRSEKIEHYTNVCLGTSCRERKTFITDSKFNRLCPRCSVLIKGCADVGI